VSVVQEFKVIYTATKPAPSWTAWKRKQAGVLTLYPDYAEFVPRKSGDSVQFRNVRRVYQPDRNDASTGLIWALNTWIWVTYSTHDGEAVAYFSGGPPFYDYVSNRRLREALKVLVARSPGSPDSSA